MARIVMGNLDGALALRQARSVLSEITVEWPDVHIVQRTLPSDDERGVTSALLDALESGSIAVAVQAMETVPYELPEGIALAAVARRLEPRAALFAKGVRSLGELADGSSIGVYSRRDRDVLGVVGSSFDATVLEGNLDDELVRLTNDEFDALLVPGSAVYVFDRRQRVDAYVDPELFAPAPGQGALALLVREEDDLGFEVAYTLQHRPSMDRVIAERSFARAVAQGRNGALIGALATVSEEGDLTLLGTATEGNGLVQGTIEGEAREGAELGAELAADIVGQLADLA